MKHKLHSFHFQSNVFIKTFYFEVLKYKAKVILYGMNTMRKSYHTNYDMSASNI